jgi:radical SAM protein with 4Fe4S-binding SPASM domain
MPQRHFRAIIDTMGKRSRHLYFHVAGEPLLHPGLADLLGTAAACQKPVNLTTNGTRIGDAQSILLSSAALRLVTFSLHSHESVAQGTSLDSYLGPVFGYIQKARHKHLICLRLWKAKDSLSSDVRRAMLQAIAREFSLDFDLEQRCAACDSVRLGNTVFLNQVTRFVWPDTNGPAYGNRGFCLGLRNQIAILVDGTVVPCCLDREGDIALGNVLAQPISVILESKRARDFYDGFSRRSVAEELCRHCSYRLRFSRENEKAF